MLQRFFLAAACLTALATISATSTSQDPDTKPQEQGRPAQFRADVRQVVLYATVYDKDDQLVSTLTKDDFEVYENKLLQEVTYFGLEDVPSTIGIVMDKSGSMRGKKDLVDQATEIFLDLNREDNEVFLVAFDDEAQLEEGFTRDSEDIRDALFNIIVSGGTALYDAIYLAVGQAQEGSETRRALVVFTDGVDKDSYYTVEELLETVQEAEVQIFLVAFLDKDLSDEGGIFGVFKSDREKVMKTMSDIAGFTGGKAFFPENGKELTENFRQIAYELRNQYRLSYVSSDETTEKAWRPIQVVVKNAREKGLRVRAKKGYYGNP